MVSTPLHPSCVPRGQRWGGGTHRFGGELVLGLQEAGWRGGEGGWCWLPPRAALSVAVLPRGTATRILTGAPRCGRLCRERRQWRGPHRQGATVPPRWEQASPSRSPPSPVMAAPPGWSHTPLSSSPPAHAPHPRPARVETRCPWRERRGGTSTAGGRLPAGSGTSAGGGAGGTVTC